MYAQDWRKLKAHADRVKTLATDLLMGPHAEALRAELRDAATFSPSRFGIHLDVTLTVYDRERGNGLQLTSLTLESGDGETPEVVSANSAAIRYLVNGDVHELPGDRCPNCWGVWKYKLGIPGQLAPSTACEQCGFELGKEVRVLLDDNSCPICGVGTVSIDSATCGNCEFTVNPNFVRWG